MNYCNHCGEKVNQGQEFCFNCGANLSQQQSQQPGQFNQQPNIQSQDTGNAGWGVLGFCFPLVGLILYIVWNKDRPRDAKSAGMGALISVIVSVVFYILYFILILGLASAL